MQTPHSEFNIFDSVSDIIGALQNIIARSQVIIPVLETPYSRFPNTDRSTIELERQSVVNIIAQRQQQLDTIMYEISGLEAVMDSVENLHQAVLEKKEKITQSMNLHEGLLSAHWRFPTEILSQIFNHCLPDYIYFLSPSSLPVQAPILLTRICRRWREVAVNTPGLWCRLYVQADDKKLLKAPFCYDLWLKRSRGHPLSLELGYHYSTKLPSLLRPYMSHITSLLVYGDYFGGRHPRLLATDLLALQELAIRGTSNDDIPTIAQSISQLPSTMRSLKFIDMTPFFDIEPLSSFSPVWAHLTDVQIAVSHPNALLHLLQLCPNLSSLNTQIEMDQGGPLKSFTHTKLQSLCIIYYASLTRTLSELLNALSLPNLHALEARYNTSWPHEDMKAFLARSKCPLETLTIGSGMTITDAQQAEYVSLTSFL
ncbi:uncharacterized protein F5891DRAFT_1280251 [Suillus fuscotomentosus]|uniref:F-box domain-containing protein n=1 Tax=Suillus fuscotomentosus TaxID=1912939 RepID=A0AAD4HIV6_9AGAM|nr:uncharacterized protein F5891DRAFT_1280251 [Suillus fuscotomentosus]KAG1897119.1 hypothetical protein F5891DRAFT_1280251 [Suillus fuscotomentosus]